MMNEDDRNDDRTSDRLMDDAAVEDAVMSYLEANPELMQGMAPERDLWAGVESRISARVLPLDAVVPHASEPRTETRSDVRVIRADRARRFQWKSWVPMAAAAAALISATSSVTYVLARRDDAPRGAAVATTAPSASASSASGNTAQRVAIQQQPQMQAEPAAVQPSVASASSASQPRQGDGDHTVQPQRSTRNSAQLVSSTGDASTWDASPRATYDEEITTLRSALNARRAQLDPATVRTIEQNLSVIDNAIAQSRAALAKDPKSQFLGSQLDRSLAKKTDLLRAAALLPSA